MLRPPCATLVYKLISLDVSHTIFTVGPPYRGGMMQNGLSVKDASLTTRPLLPSALHKIMVGLNLKSWFGFDPSWDTLSEGQRPAVVEHLLRKRSKFNSLSCYELDVTGLSWKSADLPLPCFPLQNGKYTVT